jgi:hypothetical protein
MITALKDFLRAFLWDPLAFKRWMRAFGAGVALVLVSVITYAGTDPGQIIAVLRTWSIGDWAARMALGLLFSSVHGPKPAAATALEPKP